MSNVFVPEEEYERLRQIKKEHNRLLEQQASDQRRVEQQRKLLEGEIKVNQVNEAAVDRANAARREAVAPLRQSVVGPQAAASAATEDAAEGGEDPSTACQSAPEAAAAAATTTTTLPRAKGEREKKLALVAQGSSDLSNLADAFSSPAQWSKAMRFLQKALVHQSVHIDRGLMYLDGFKIGHIILVLYHLFGREKGGLSSGIQHRAKLGSFVREMGMHHHHHHHNQLPKAKTSRRVAAAAAAGTRKKQKTKKTAKIPSTTTAAGASINPELYHLLK